MVCADMFVHMYVPVYTCGETEKEPKGPDVLLCHTLLRQYLLLTPGAGLSALPRVWDLQACTAMPVYLGAENLNSDLQVCVLLPSEASP